ncbi:MAG: winged helix-turn-helix domain-containing protein [Spirosomataceae bacterium]
MGKFTFYPHRYELKATISYVNYRIAKPNYWLFWWKISTLLSNVMTFLQRVWGDDSFFNSRNLDVYITRLREYIREDPSLEILTLKGVGYLFKSG